ncbi:hypothetical protein D018_2040B, partial [Vibrio parahaemolyticus VP2007-007]
STISSFDLPSFVIS